MPFVQAKCTNCGGVLAVDDSLDAAVCPFCNTPYIVEKAINNYNITNNINVGDGATVNIYGGIEKDFEIKAGTLVKYIGESQEVVIPDIVTVIGEKAFYGLNITKVVLPKGLVSIKKEAFMNCKMLTDISIPETVKIGSYAFCNTPIWSTKNGVCKKCGGQLKKVSIVDRLYKYKYRCTKCNTYYK